jgi:hypothetical protein
MPDNIKEPPAHYYGSIIDWKALSPQSRKRVRRYANKDTKNAQNKIYRAANKDAIRTQNKIYYAANKDAINANKNNTINAPKRRAYREANKDKAKVYRKANKDKAKGFSTAYYQLNRDTIRGQQRNYRIKKAKEFYALFGTWEIEPGIY